MPGPADRASDGQGWPGVSANFACAICQHDVDMRWERHRRPDRSTPIAPICRLCESHYSEGNAAPRHGSFRDRREVTRGFAVAEALHNAAMLTKWNSHARA